MEDPKNELEHQELKHEITRMIERIDTSFITIDVTLKMILDKLSDSQDRIKDLEKLTDFLKTADIDLRLKVVERLTDFLRIFEKNKALWALLAIGLIVILKTKKMNEWIGIVF